MGVGHGCPPPSARVGPVQSSEGWPGGAEGKGQVWGRCGSEAAGGAHGFSLREPNRLQSSDHEENSALEEQAGTLRPRQPAPCRVTTPLRVRTGRPPPLPALGSPGGALRPPTAAPTRAPHLRTFGVTLQISGRRADWAPGGPSFQCV